MNNNNIDTTRESDVLKLCKSIIEMDVNVWYNPNGPDEWTCPICHEQGMRDSSMRDIQHLPECGYLIAKDLSTGLL